MKPCITHAQSNYYLIQVDCRQYSVAAAAAADAADAVDDESG